MLSKVCPAIQSGLLETVGKSPQPAPGFSLGAAAQDLRVKGDREEETAVVTFFPKENLIQKPKTKKSKTLAEVGWGSRMGPVGIILPMIHLYPGGLEGSQEDILGKARALKTGPQ